MIASILFKVFLIKPHQIAKKPASSISFILNPDCWSHSIEMHSGRFSNLESFASSLALLTLHSNTHVPKLREFN